MTNIEQRFDTILRLWESEHTLYLCYRLRRYKRWLRSPERYRRIRYHEELRAQIEARRAARTHDRIMRTFLKQHRK